MAALAHGDVAALVATVPFAPDVPIAVAIRDGQGHMVELLQGCWPDGSPVVSGQKFYAASLAKQVTGAAVALLCKRGVLDPSDRLGRFIADLPPWVHDLTIRHLLGHTGGLPPAGQLESRLGDASWTTAGAINATRSLASPAYVPGSRFSYSNLGYVCLARVVERASGLDFGSFVQQSLFAPLGLTETIMAREDDVPSFPQAAMMGPGLPLSCGDGGLWTTAPGFVRWLEHQNEDTLSVARLVETGARLNDGTVTDYGWGIGLRSHRGEPLFSHGGSWRGGSSKAVRSRAFGVSIAAFAADDTEQDNVVRLVSVLLDAAT